MQYRYSRGQTGQGSLPRPAWGSGSHGTRATSPEPGGGASAPPSNGAEGPKERLGSGVPPQDEVILQLENELMELRNACQWKDQRIAELSRSDLPVARMKRDIRILAADLHHTRKQLAELQESQNNRSEVGVTSRDINTVSLGRDIADSPSAGGVGEAVVSGSGAVRGVSGSADRANERSLRESIAQLQDENRQLKETVARLQMAPAHDGLHHARQPSGASTQRSSESSQPHPTGTGAMPGLAAGGYRSSDPGPAAQRGGYLAQGPGQPVAGGTGPAQGTQAAAAPQAPQEEQQVFQTVYSTVHTEHTATIGPTALQGIGTVDGVSSVAKVLLSRIGSSVCAAHRRPVNAAMPGAGGQPLQPGQIPMVMVGLPQGM